MRRLKSTLKPTVKSLLSLSLIWAGSAWLACAPTPQVGAGSSLGEQAQPIINGLNCDEAENSSAVALILEGTADMGWMGTMPIRTVMCTGTLIAPDTVLTAAHCLMPELMMMGMGTFKDPKFYVSFTADLRAMVETMGELPALPADAAEVKIAIKHPGFTMQTATGTPEGPGNWQDIGLIFLKEPVTTVQPATLITAEEASQIVKDAPVTIAGWGQQTAEKSNPFTPPAAGSLAIKICAQSTINEVGEFEMQVGSGSASSRKCHGDSGGPSYMEVQSDTVNKLRLVGITSHAYDATDCAKGGVDTRVDVWLDWIDGHMTDICEAGDRSWCEVPGIVPPDYDFGFGEPTPDQGAELPEDGGVAAADSGTGEQPVAQADGGAEQNDDEADETDDGGCSVAAGRLDARLPGSLLLLFALFSGLLYHRRRA